MVERDVLLKDDHEMLDRCPGMDAVIVTVAILRNRYAGGEGESCGHAAENDWMFH